MPVRVRGFGVRGYASLLLPPMMVDTCAQAADRAWDSVELGLGFGLGVDARLGLGFGFGFGLGLGLRLGLGLGLGLGSGSGVTGRLPGAPRNSEWRQKSARLVRDRVRDGGRCRGRVRDRNSDRVRKRRQKSAPYPYP